MANKKIVKRIVVHPKYYMAVAGKLQHVKPGTEITCSVGHAERHKLKLADPADKAKLKDGKIVKGDPPESEALAELTAKLDTAQKEADDAKAETVKVTKALTTTATKLNAMKEKVKALEAAAKK